MGEYYPFRGAYPRQDWKERLGNPVWPMHDGNPPDIDMPVPFSLLLNLVSASNAQNKDVLWGFISRHTAGVTPKTHPELDQLAPGLAGLGDAVAVLLDEGHVTPRAGTECARVVVGQPEQVQAVLGDDVPLLARDLARLAADAERGVGEEADALLGVRAVALGPGGGLAHGSFPVVWG